MEKGKSRLKRPVYPMTDDVREALVTRDLMEKYKSRPPYQQNDYIGWITRARREDTRQRRLQEMLDDLEKGERYMGMVYKPKARKS